jgi:hypothetical protein
MSLTVERSFHLANVSGRRGGVRRVVREGAEPASALLVVAGRVPRIAKLMALAIRCEQMIRSGAVPDATALARLAHVSQPRMTQILNLTLLSPDLQEALLFLPPVEARKPEVSEKGLRGVCAELKWEKQRALASFAE